MTEETKEHKYAIRAFVVSHTGAFKKLEKNLTDRDYFDKYVTRKDKNGDTFIGLMDTRAVRDEERRKGIILIKADKAEDAEMLLKGTLEIVQKVITINMYYKSTLPTKKTEEK